VIKLEPSGVKMEGPEAVVEVPEGAGEQLKRSIRMNYTTNANLSTIVSLTSVRASEVEKRTSSSSLPVPFEDPVMPMKGCRHPPLLSRFSAANENLGLRA